MSLSSRAATFRNHFRMLVNEKHPRTSYAISRATGVPEDTLEYWKYGLEKRPPERFQLPNLLKVAAFLDFTAKEVDELLSYGFLTSLALLWATQQHLPELSHWQEAIRIQLADIAAQEVPAKSIVPPVTLPFFGRQTEIAELCGWIRAAVQDNIGLVCWISGVDGAGKTQLARAAVHTLKQEGLFKTIINLELSDDREDDQITIARSIINRLQQSGPKLDEHLMPRMDKQRGVHKEEADKRKEKRQETQLRYRLRRIYRTLIPPRTLILVDSVKNAEQIRLLEPPPSCILLITSDQMPEPLWRRCPYDDETTRTLLVNRSLSLAGLDVQSAVTMLHTLCPEIGDAAAALARWCRYLPLTLAISAGLIANRPPKISTHALLRELEDALTLHLPITTSEHASEWRQKIDAAFAASYNHLSLDAREVLKRLCIFAGSFDVTAARYVLFEDQKSEAQVNTLLNALCERHLLTIDSTLGTDAENYQQRYIMHIVVRVFARAKLPDCTKPKAVCYERLGWRQARYYHDLAARAQAIYLAGDGYLYNVSALRVMYQDGEQIRVGLRWVMTHAGSRVAPRQSAGLTPMTYIDAVREFLPRFLTVSERIDVLERTFEALGEAVMTDASMAWAWLVLGDAYNDLALTPPGHVELALARYAMTWELAQQDMERDAQKNPEKPAVLSAAKRREIKCRMLLGGARLHARVARHLSQELAQEHVAIHHQHLVQQRTDLWAAAETSVQLAIALAKKAPRPDDLCLAYSYLGDLYLAQGRNQIAFDCYEQALETAQELHARRLETYTLLVKLWRDLGHAHVLIGSDADDVHTSISPAQAQAAEACYAQSRKLANAIHDMWGIAWAGWGQGIVALKRGDPSNAMTLMQPLVDLEQQYFSSDDFDRVQHTTLLEEARRRISTT